MPSSERARLRLRCSRLDLTPDLTCSETCPLHPDRTNGAVATLTLNRPDALNTLDFAMMDALVAAAADVAGDDALRVVVMRGAGQHFMAGGDLRTFAGDWRKPPGRAQRATSSASIGRCTPAIEHSHRMPHPVIGQRAWRRAPDSAFR